jgi:hypothetical protein
MPERRSVLPSPLPRCLFALTQKPTLERVGDCQEFPQEKGAIRLVFSVGAMIHGRVPAEGTGHFAVNEGQVPTLMILTEIKGTATEKSKK